jgi:tetratricopeptide (TPR) repeat protein
MCTRIPLLDYLGYEFSALIALIGSILSGFIVIPTVRTAYRAASVEPKERLSQVKNLLFDLGRSTFGLLLIPLVIISANAVFVRNCSWSEGLAFFVLLAAGGVGFGGSMAFFCAVMFRHSRVAFGGACILLLMYSAALGYWTPALFSYNFLYGYFPGFTYDEVVVLSDTLVVFRIITVGLSALFVLLGMLVFGGNEYAAPTVKKLKGLAYQVVRGWRWIPSDLVVAILGTLYAYRCELGFESTAGYIQSMLGGLYRTGHFTIYYAPSSLDSSDIRLVAEEHEFRLNQVLTALSASGRVTFESYVYPSAEMKRRLIGAGNTDITKPWSGQIHLSRQSLGNSLKHELVHAAAAPFGFPVLKASLSTGLVEGLAMAVDGSWGNRTLHQYAAGMRASGIAPNIKSIMTPWGFVSEQPAVSYVLAGSFCRYLIDRFGIRRFLSVYRHADYAIAYGRTLDRLVADWERFLERIPVDRGDLDAVDATFRRPSIFRKTCARVLARRLAEAGAAFGANRYASAESLYASCYAEGHGYEAFAGYLVSALRGGEYQRVLAAFDTVILRDDHPARYLPLFVDVGDCYWKTGNTFKAFKLYDRVQHAAISKRSLEAAAVRMLAIKEDPEGRTFLQYFLTAGSDTVHLKIADSLLRLDPTNPLLLYLQGRLLLRLKDFAEAASVFRTLNLSGSNDALEALRLQFLGDALFRLGRYEESRAAYWISLNHSDREADREHVEDLIDRCEWIRDHGI